MQMKNYIVFIIFNSTERSIGDIRRLQATSFNYYNEDQRGKFKYNKKYVHLIQYIPIQTTHPLNDWLPRLSPHVRR